MITLAVPATKSQFSIDNEIAEARNIKDKEVRNSTLAGLLKIKSYL